MKPSFLRHVSLSPFFISLACHAGVGVAGAGLVLNPSFEESYNESTPHYGAIDQWFGGSGTNRSNGPFHNASTPIPDGTQVAFMQESKNLTQGIFGLEPGQVYWIQFFYDARACCGGVIDLQTKWDDTLLDTISGVTPITGGEGYRFRNVAFTPESADGTLGFSSVAAGDDTVLMDGVTIVRGGAGRIVVMNPSFEASGTPPEPGTLAAAAGWTGFGSGTAGVNDSTGPYADNGTIPEQDHVAFLRGEMTISQTLRGLAAGTSYTVSFKCNATTANAPQLLVTVDGSEIFNGAVVPVGGDAAYRTVSATFTAAATTAQLNFAQTAAGEQTVLLDDLTVTGVVVEPIPNVKLTPPVVEVGPGTRATATFTVSTKRLETSSSTILVSIINDGVARLVDADELGQVALEFPQGAVDPQLTVDIEGVGRGVTLLRVDDNGGHDGVDGSVRIEGVTSFVKNASFETTAPPLSVNNIGNGVIMGWQNNPASSGINNNTMPFYDNGIAPDRGQVAWIQGSQVLSQEITGLEPGKQYAVQLYYNARNCCDGGTMDLQVRFAGQELAAAPGVLPAGPGAPFYFMHGVFTADAAEGLLELATTAGGDASLLVDAVNIVPFNAGEIVVKNPSFEASGSPVGVGYSDSIAGWFKTGGGGINVDTLGPFSDNGVAGAQDRVGFLQGPTTLSQLIEGLIEGEEYTLTYLVNARSGDSPGPSPYRVMIDGQEIYTENQEPVGIGVPYALKTIPFTAASTVAELSFQGFPFDDQSLLLDDIRILAGAVPAGQVALSIALIGGNAVDISWPTTAPSNLVLQTSTSLTTASWSNVTAIAVPENGFNHVLDVVDGPRRFYRLVRP